MNINQLLRRLLQLFALRALWRTTRRSPAQGQRRTTPAGPARAQREAAKRARHAARITRRLSRR